MTGLIRIAVVVAALGVLAPAVHAAQKQENDALASASAKVTLEEAVKIAEGAAHGKASRAEFELEKSGGVYEVEVVAADAVYDVRVDAAKGSVLSSDQDKADHEDDDHDGGREEHEEDDD